MKALKHKMNTGTIETYIIVFILVLVLFKVMAQLFPDVTGAAGDLNESGFPLAELFLDNGALWYLVAAGLIFLVYRSLSGGLGNRK